MNAYANRTRCGKQSAIARVHSRCRGVIGDVSDHSMPFYPSAPFKSERAGVAARGRIRLPAVQMFQAPEQP